MALSFILQLTAVVLFWKLSYNKNRAGIYAEKTYFVNDRYWNKSILLN